LSSWLSIFMESNRQNFYSTILPYHLSLNFNSFTSWQWKWLNRF
jgi:hypothetical protein